MKKMMVFLVLSLVFGFGHAENINKDYKVTAFNSLDVSGVFNVTLTKGNTCSVSITTEEEIVPYLRIRVEGQELKLGFVEGGVPKSIQKKFKNYTVKAQVTMPMIKGLEMSGVTNFRTTDNFETSFFELDMSGVSKVEFATLTCATFSADMSGVASLYADLVTEDVTWEISGASNATVNYLQKDVTFAEVEISGSSSLTVEGKVVRCDLSVSGAAKYEGARCKVETMRVDISGAAKADVMVTGTLQPEVSGAAKLRYTGGCSIKNLDVSGAGKISSY